MEGINVKIKRLDNNRDLPLPSYQSKGSAGLDLQAAVQEDVVLKPGDIKLIPTGLSIAFPPGYEAQIRPRSGLALKHGLGLVNSPGTIDSDYRGEIGIIVINWGKKPITIKRGDRIAQIIISKICKVNITEVRDLDSTDRGKGGFGHSGV